MKWLQRHKEPIPVIPVTELQQVDDALRAGRAVVYKHSPACWTCVMALRHIKTFVEAYPDVPVYQIDVLAERDLSQEVARRLDIRHESPQAIAIVKGAVAWSGSHFEVTHEALTRAMDSGGA